MWGGVGEGCHGSCRSHLLSFGTAATQRKRVATMWTSTNCRPTLVEGTTGGDIWRCTCISASCPSGAPSAMFLHLSNSGTSCRSWGWNLCSRPTILLSFVLTHESAGFFFEGLHCPWVSLLSRPVLLQAFSLRFISFGLTHELFEDSFRGNSWAKACCYLLQKMSPIWIRWKRIVACMH